MSENTTAVLNDWLVRLGNGDPRARDALIERALDRLRRLVARMMGDFARVRRFDDTDDVLQNAVLRLMRRLEAEVPKDAVAFFATAARETRCALIDLVRSRFGPLGLGRNEAAPPAQSPSQDTFSGPPQSTLMPDQLAVWAEFHECVERLPDDERTIFDLLWYQGLTQPEAAALLGVSVPTVKRRWMAARMALQDKLPGAAGIAEHT